jgi:hypothetical protein
MSFDPTRYSEENPQRVMQTTVAILGGVWCVLGLLILLIGGILHARDHRANRRNTPKNTM